MGLNVVCFVGFVTITRNSSLHDDHTIFYLLTVAVVVKAFMCAIIISVATKNFYLPR